MGASDKAVAEKAAQAVPVFNLLNASWPYSQPVNVCQRLMLIMRECTYIQKSDKKAGMQFDFVSYDVVAAKLHPLLTKYGVLPFPSLISHTINGNRVEAVYDVTFVNVDNPDDKLVSTQLSFGVDNQDKAPGKACTYAVKTALLRTFCLEAGKGEDPDANQGPEYDHQPATISDTQLETLTSKAAAAGVHMPSFCEFFHVKDLSDLLATEYDRALKGIEAKAKANAKTKKQPATIEGETA